MSTIWGLFIEYELTGHTTLLTFDRAEERGYHMVLLSSQPVRLTCVEWAA